MTRPPRLTVCIPAYNQPAYLRDALESLCDQGLARDEYVVLVSDDASPAPLGDVVSAFADRLQVVYDRSETNVGHLENFGRAFELARTPYVSFLSHDDVIAPGQLGRALALFDRHPETVLVASLILVQPYAGAVDTRPHGMFLQGASRGRLVDPYHWDPTEWLALALITTPLAITGSVFQADVFARCRYWKSFPLWHDRLMLAEMGLYGAVSSLPWIGGHYRVTDAQLSAKLWEDNQREFREVSDLLLALAAAANLPVIEFWIDHVCRVPEHERAVYLRLLKTALGAERFGEIRKTCEQRLGIRLPLTRLERYGVPDALANLVRDLDRVLARKLR